MSAVCRLEREECKLKKFNREGVLVGARRFCEDVGRLFGCGNMFEIDLICGMNFVDVVIVGIDVLGVQVIDVLGVIYSRFRVGEDCKDWM